jgi:ribosomal-protein-alanine N-acetyltransferase
VINILENILNSKNFNLEPILPIHAEKLFDFTQEHSLYTYIPVNMPESVTALRSKFQLWSGRGSKDNREIWLNYAIFSPEVESFVGTLQATIERDGHTYVAYEIYSNFRRKGYAKEAVQFLIDFLKNQFNIKRVRAHLDTRNISSLKLLESLGFVKVGMIENADFFKGKSSNEFIYEKTLGV